MLITSNMNSANSEKRRQKTRTRLIDLETALLSKKKSVRIMMPRSRLSTMIFLKLRRDQMSSKSWLIPRNSNLEEQMRQWTLQIPNSQDAKMTIQDLWLRLKHFKEISMANLATNQTCRDKLRMRMPETEI